MIKPAVHIPGTSPPRKWRECNTFDIVLLIVIMIASVAFIYKAIDVADYSWNWASILPYILVRNPEGAWQSGLLLTGLYTTLRIGFWSMVLAIITGSVVGTLSAYQKGFASLPFVIYIQGLRNLPPLILLFLVFFFAGSLFTEPLISAEAWVADLPSFLKSTFYTLIAPEGQFDRMFATVLTLGLYEGAYVAEIVRAGIESVPKSQWAASASQGFTLWQSRRYIIAPQAMRFMLPPLIGQTINTFKDSAISSIISMPELTFQSLEIMTVSRITFELWLTVALLYLLISFFWSRLGVYFEKRQKWRPIV